MQADSLQPEQSLPQFNPVVEDMNHLFMETDHLISTREGGKHREMQYFLILAPVFLPGESHGQMTLASYRPWGLEELDAAE